MSTRFLALGLAIALVLLAPTGVAKEPSAEVKTLIEISAARELPPISTKARGTLATTKAKLGEGDRVAAKAAFKKWLETEKPRRAHAKVVATWLVRDAVLGKNKVLSDAADRARFYAEQRAELRAFLQELRELAQSGAETVDVKLLSLTATYSTGAAAYTYAATATTLNQKQLAALIAKVEGQYKTASDMTQMMQMDLQDAMQKQQQAVAILSAILKDMHDTLKAIIQNLKA
jgi:hypothetical protein